MLALVSREDFNILSLTTPNFGNQYGMYLEDNCFLPGGFDYQYHYSRRIIALLKSVYENDFPAVAELGTGYGGMAYDLARDLPQCRLILLDLPTILTISQAYLIFCLGISRSVELYDEMGSKELGIKILFGYSPVFALKILMTIRLMHGSIAIQLLKCLHRRSITICSIFLER